MVKEIIQGDNHHHLLLSGLCLIDGEPATGAEFLWKNGFIQPLAAKVLITLCEVAEHCFNASQSLSGNSLNVC